MDISSGRPEGHPVIRPAFERIKEEFISLFGHLLSTTFEQFVDALEITANQVGSTCPHTSPLFHQRDGYLTVIPPADATALAYFFDYRGEPKLSSETQPQPTPLDTTNYSQLVWTVRRPLLELSLDTSLEVEPDDTDENTQYEQMEQMSAMSAGFSPPKTLPQDDQPYIEINSQVAPEAQDAAPQQPRRHSSSSRGGKAHKFITIRENPGFYCPIESCKKMFQSRSPFVSHFLDVHREIKTVKCPDCSQNLAGAGLMFMHHYFYHQRGDFRCSYCNFVDHLRTNMFKHYGRAHHNSDSSRRSSGESIPLSGSKRKRGTSNRGQGGSKMAAMMNYPPTPQQYQQQQQQPLSVCFDPSIWSNPPPNQGVNHQQQHPNGNSSYSGYWQDPNVPYSTYSSTVPLGDQVHHRFTSSNMMVNSGSGPTGATYGQTTTPGAYSLPPPAMQQSSPGAAPYQNQGQVASYGSGYDYGYASFYEQPSGTGYSYGQQQAPVEGAPPNGHQYGGTQQQQQQTSFDARMATAAGPREPSKGAPPPLGGTPPAGAPVRFRILRDEDICCPVGECPLKFSSKPAYFTHFHSAHSEVKHLSCGKCPHTSVGAYAIYQHELYDHREGIFQCAYTGCRYLSNLRTHVMDHFNEAHLGLPVHARNRGQRATGPVASVASFYG